MKKEGKMKRIAMFTFLFFFLLGTSWVHSQPPLDKFFERLGPKIHSDDLRVLQLDMSPDPALEGQRVTFQATLSNLSHYPGRVSLYIKDRDEVVTWVEDVMLRTGHNRILFPQTGYRFSRREHCFTVEVDIERTRRPIDVVREFCARRTYSGWTLKEVRVGPLFVENLEMHPDPAMPGQEVRFRVRIRNDGIALRAHLRIQDRDQMVASLNDVYIPPGYSEYHFPYARYIFQRFDHCFMVFVDVERTPHRIDSAREFCAKPMGWTLRP